MQGRLNVTFTDLEIKTEEGGGYFANVCSLVYVLVQTHAIFTIIRQWRVQKGNRVLEYSRVPILELELLFRKQNAIVAY